MATALSMGTVRVAFPSDPTVTVTDPPVADMVSLPLELYPQLADTITFWLREGRRRYVTLLHKAIEIFRYSTYAVSSGGQSHR